MLKIYLKLEYNLPYFLLFDINIKTTAFSRIHWILSFSSKIKAHIDS